MTEIRAQAVPKVYAPSYCAAYAAELDEETRHILSHIHRCNGTHTERNGLTIHSCECTAEFYFVEDAIDLLLSKLREREVPSELTGLDQSERQYIDHDGNLYTLARSPEQ